MDVLAPDRAKTPSGGDSEEEYMLHDVPARIALSRERRAARLNKELMVHACTVVPQDPVVGHGLLKSRRAPMTGIPHALTSTRAAGATSGAKQSADRGKTPQKGGRPS